MAHLSSDLTLLNTQVNFLPLNGFLVNAVEPETLTHLQASPSDKKISLAFSTAIDMDVIANLNRFAGEKVALIIEEKTPSLRRAEMLLGSNVVLIYSFSGDILPTWDLARICRECLHARSVRAKGVKRILNLETEEPQQENSLRKVFADGVLTEITSNPKIASLQLKGQRASGLFLSKPSASHVADISQILPDHLNAQVLLNQHNLSPEVLHEIRKCKIAFKMVNISSEDELFKICQSMALPTLTRQVWSNPDAKLNAKINLILQKKEAMEEVICLEGEKHQKGVENLSLFNSRTVADSLEATATSKLLHHKNAILEKQIIVLNANSKGIQTELIRLLYSASSISHIVIAVGTEKTYTKLLETASNYEDNPYYSQRSIHTYVCPKEKLILLLKELVESLEIVLDEEENPFHRKLFKPFETMQNHIDMLMGQIQREFPSLMAAVDLDSNESQSIILQNLLDRFARNTDEWTIFNDMALRKDFHQFLSSITPEASKTAFPDNPTDLALIIQSLIFLILKKPGPKITKNKKILTNIETMGLEITSLHSYASELETLMRSLKKALVEPLSSGFGKAKSDLDEHLNQLDFIIRQILLQWSFIQLATPDPGDFTDYKPLQLSQTEYKKTLPYFSELFNLQNLLGEVTERK
ncbi:MAG: hypothetical protein CR997_04915 [Acidobacteria bacterium]|nr:MAG: hypothetical protein CR997_04915 [Acidobacteriota bacterium]